MKDDDNVGRVMVLFFLILGTLIYLYCNRIVNAAYRTSDPIVKELKK